MIGGLLHILLLGPPLIVTDGLPGLLNLLPVLLCGLLLGCLPLTRQEKGIQRVWEVYDERLQYMFRQDALLLDASLDSGDVSRAWLVWSGAAEAALADACRFSGGS